MGRTAPGFEAANVVVVGCQSERDCSVYCITPQQSVEIAVTGADRDWAAGRSDPTPPERFATDIVRGGVRFPWFIGRADTVGVYGDLRAAQNNTANEISVEAEHTGPYFARW